MKKNATTYFYRKILDNKEALKIDKKSATWILKKIQVPVFEL